MLLPFSNPLMQHKPVEGTTSDAYFSNVKLLLGFNGADGSTTITDESPAAHGNAVVVANAQIDTAQSKFGTGSLLLDGTGDNIQYADSPDWHFASSDDFTIEAWVRFNSVSGYQTFLSQWDFSGASFSSWTFMFSDADNELWFGYSSTGNDADLVLVDGLWNPVINNWYHVAVDKAAGTLRTYVDGAMIGKAVGVPSFANVSMSLRIGSNGDVLTGEQDNFNGWMDEVRITKGVARYASDAGYSIPTQAFPRS